MSLKKYRLKGKEFEKTLKEGKSFREDFLILKKRKNNLSQIRIGFLISKKLSKKAIQRNKIKRRLRELIRKKLGKIQEDQDIIFIALPGLEKRDFRELGNIIDKIFLKANLIKYESDRSNL